MDNADNIPQVDAPVEPPLGMYTSRLDERGRLKLPSDFQTYVSKQEKRLFVTSLERKITRIYFLADWRKNEKFLSEQTKNKTAANNILFTANELGAQVEMDNQGRVPLSAELRQELKIENGHQVRLYHKNGRIEVLGEAVFAAQKAQASNTPEQDLLSMEEAGLL